MRHGRAIEETMEIAFDIGAGIMLTMGSNTCKLKSDRVSKVSGTHQKRGRYLIS